MNSTWAKVPAVFITAVLIGLGAFWFVSYAFTGSGAASTPTPTKSGTAASPSSADQPIQNAPPSALGMNIDLGRTNAAECILFQNVYNASVGPVLNTPASQWNGNESAFYTAVGNGFHELEMTVSGYTDQYSQTMYMESVALAEDPRDAAVEHRFTTDLVSFEQFCGGTSS